MKEEAKTENTSGNIWGWKFSFISFLIILVTLIATIISERVKEKYPELLPEQDSLVIDSTHINNKLDAGH